ncbi:MULTISPECIES: phage tail protein [unclassified Lactococcus]|uniref:phage tail protein n=1 Tax=unclassified Lactococcus TaxID=2643510 RepID=UPI0011C7D8E2|nr:MULTISPECIES: phage tail protein [unclassified Lactococcus]MQW22188.1 phage tail protein [Lactococcus sp. dk101]TXK45122.1 phage tail protein [Lactococcus sp. dk310]TXK51098.1 phage tail protein [Lactococcus sp. dk322]
MEYQVDFKNVETIGLESSPVAEQLAGLRANEARYFWNKYKFNYVVYSADEKTKEIEWLNKILQDERDLAFSAPILEVAIYEDDMLYWPEFYFEDGMVLNVLYEKVPAAEGKKPKRAVGIKLSVGMEVPKELEGKFKFARQKSKLAGEVRGSFFTLKKEWL